MASSSLRPQNSKQKEIAGILKKLELNKLSENLTFKPLTAQSPKRGSENRDPNETCNHTKGVNKLKSVSRLPVLAKSLQTCQIPSHGRWEERPLLGKAQKRKTCTKPNPFSLSQAGNSRQMSRQGVSVTESTSGAPLSCGPPQAPSKTQDVPPHRTETGAAAQTAASLNTYKHHQINTEAKTVPFSLGHHTVAASDGKALAETRLTDDRLSNEMTSSIQRDLSTQLSSITLSHSEFAQSYSVGISEAEDKADYQAKTNGCIQTPLSAHFTRAKGVSGCVQSEGVDRTAYLSQRVSVKKLLCSGTEALSENTVAFSPDPAALCSILLNEGVKAEGLAAGTPRVSARPSGRGTSIYSARRVPVRKLPTHIAAESVGGGVSFYPDPSALRNILLNDGVKVDSSVRVTPRVSVCPSGRGTSVYSAQRVPVKKAQTATSALPRTNGGAVPFSPDPAALRSILLNEGVNMGGPGGATPHTFSRPSVRETSIYSAQRVPVKRTGPGVPPHPGASRTPAGSQMKQHVPSTQLHSARRLISARKTSFFDGSPRLSETQAPSTDGSAQHEEFVVQRLFQEEPEQEENKRLEEGGNRALSGQVQEHQHTQDDYMDTDRCCAQKNEPSSIQPFIQAVHRQSVIVFSSGLQPLKPGLGHPGGHTAAPPTPRHTGRKESSAAQTSGSQSAQNPDANKRMMPSVACKKASSSTLAACALSRRLTPLEELFLDEECATYTLGQQSRAPQARCTNPVASMLLFHDSTCFVPIGVPSPQLGPVAHLSLPTRG